MHFPAKNRLVRNSIAIPSSMILAAVLRPVTEKFATSEDPFRKHAGRSVGGA